MIYYSIIILLSLCSVLNQFEIKKSYIGYLAWVSFIFILIIGGLRFEVGADWESYKELFFDVSSWSDVFSQRVELLYSSVSYLIKQIFDDYSIFIFLLFLLSFALKYYVIRIFSPDIFISFIVYISTIFLIYDINQLRQGVALGFALVSIKYILNKNIYKFFAALVIASLFHISALFFFPFYFLARIKFNNRTIILLLFVVFSFSTLLRSFLVNSDVFQLLIFSDEFSHYSGYVTDDFYNLNIPIVSVAVLQRIFVFLLFLIAFDHLKIKKDFAILLRNGYFIGIILFLLLSFSSEFAARISVYYKIMEIIMIPLMVCSAENKYKNLSLSLVFVMFFMTGVYRLLSIPGGHLLPYQNLIFL